MPLPSFDDLFDIAEREILFGESDIDPAEIRRPGSDAYIVVVASATMGDQIAQKAREELAGLFFESAKGQRLQRLARDRYRLTIYGAAASRGQLTFYRNDTTGGAQTIDSNTSCASDAGLEYLTLESVDITVNGPVNARAVCRATGAETNAKNGTIRRVLTELDDPNIQVTNAIALVKFTRAAAGADGVIPVGTQIRDAYGNTYKTVSDLAIAAAQTIGYVPVAIDAGHGFNAPAEADTLTTLLDTLFDTFTVTNPVKTGGAFSGGDDDETEANFQARCEKFWAAARRGVLSAVEYGAKTVDGIRHAQAVEITHDDDLNPARAIHLLVADINGIANEAILDEVRAIVPDYAAGGIPVFVEGGEVEDLDITLSLGMLRGYDQALLAEQVQNIANAYLFAKPPSTGVAEAENEGRFEVSEAVSLLLKISGVYVPAGAVVIPTTDYTPTRGKSLRLGTLTIGWI